MSPTPQTTPIDGALVVPLQRHEDARGWFLEARRESWFEPLGGKRSKWSAERPITFEQMVAATSGAPLISFDEFAQLNRD